MVHTNHFMTAIALCSGLLWAPSSVSAHEGSSSDGRKASAQLDFRIIIPVVLRIIENSHPPSLPVADTQTSRISTLQRMVLVTTLRKGFCMDLQLTRTQLTDWKLHVSGSADTRIESSEAGYRVCTNRAGRYDLALKHDFKLKDGTRENSAPALDWPINVSLASP
jgi:hypothetical protein